MARCARRSSTPTTRLLHGQPDDCVGYGHDRDCLRSDHIALGREPQFPALHDPQRLDLRGGGSPRALRAGAGRNRGDDRAGLLVVATRQGCCRLSPPADPLSRCPGADLGSRLGVFPSRSIRRLGKSFSSPLGRLDHRHDAGLQGLGQVGPCFDYGGKAGVIGQQAGSILGSSQGTD